MEKIILVTGASSGIGMAFVNLLHARGDIVYGASRKGDLGGLPGDDRLRGIVMDVTNTSSVEAAVSEVVARHGRIDALIHCAGMGVSGPLENTDDRLLDLQFNTNVMGMMRVSRAVLPVMRENMNGRIILFGSVAGRISIPYQGAYSASKAAISSLARSMRAEVKPYGIQCSVIEPGDIHTNFTANRVKAELAVDSPYADACERAVSQMEKDETEGTAPEKIAGAVIKHVLDRGRMPVRYVPGAGYRSLCLLQRILPDRLVEFVVSKMY